ncbi:MAG: hypothetical protein KA096_01365 [Bacteroidales bacterium]|nr:hypothetical protein [Bacteroidales bacterium]
MLVEDCKALSISDLKRWGYLKPKQYLSGVVTWYQGQGENKRVLASISILVCTYNEYNPFLELDYSHFGTPINYQVELTAIPSNLGKGVVWFFICPRTGIRCRKLHLVGGYFYHRSAFKGCLYEKQKHSHKTRNLYKYFEVIFGNEKPSKPIRTNYAGKPTKRFMKAMEKDYKARVTTKELLKSNNFKRLFLF